MASFFFFLFFLLYVSNQVGFKEALNDSLELRTLALGGISALLHEQLRCGFNAFVGLAITEEISLWE